MLLPSDIRAEINRRFPVQAERAEVRKLLGSLWRRYLNVGPEQLARAVLVLAGGELATVKAIMEADFYGDPRDIIVSAHAAKPGCYYGLGAFVEAAKIELRERNDYGLICSAPTLLLPIGARAELWIDPERANQRRFSPHQLQAFEQFLTLDKEQVAAMYRALAAEGQQLLAAGRITPASLSRRNALQLTFRAAILPRQHKTAHRYVLLLADTYWKIKGSKSFIELEILFENNTFQFLQEYAGLWTRPDWDYAYNVPLAQYRAGRQLPA